MAVIDEKSRVPPIDEAALARLSHALDQDGVIAAMLIGSQARGPSVRYRTWTLRSGMTRSRFPWSPRSSAEACRGEAKSSSSPVAKRAPRLGGAS